MPFEKMCLSGAKDATSSDKRRARTLTTAHLAVVGEDTTMTDRPRDSQRSRVYAAERAAFGDAWRKPLGSGAVADIEAFVRKCCASKLLQRRYPGARRPPRIRDGRGHRRCTYDPSIHALTFPRWGRTKPVVLHELAHALTEGPDRAWHGWEFCECYLYLVRVFIGRGAEDNLRREFKARRVKFRQPRTRQMTDEQREAARQRMLAMHARKRHEADPAEWDEPMAATTA
jgi:putative metallohydrolase (TIGR04338 family)